MAVPLGTGHRATWVLRPQRIVLRVASGSGAALVAAREVAVGRWLAARDAPATPPLSHGGPYRLAGAVVTLWPWVDHARTAGEGDAAVAADALAALHAALRGYPGVLPAYTAKLDSVARLLAERATPLALDHADRALLADLLRDWREDLPDPAAGVPLHGDAHPGNLLLGGARPVWTDFEDACLGPPEHDIACLPPAAWPLFEAADRALVARCAALRSICVATWCAARPQADAGVREALAHHLGLVRERRV